MSVRASELMQAAKWELLPPQQDSGDGIPHATHHGTLTIMGCELECYRLSNGQNIFTEESLLKFFGIDSMADILETPKDSKESEAR